MTETSRAPASAYTVPASDGSAMYQARILAELLGARKQGAAWTRVPRAVLLLGVTSCFIDAADELVATVLPLYLLYGLDLSPLAAGAISGAQAGGGAVLRLAGAALADHWQRAKELAVLGYAISFACKLGLVQAGASPAALGGLIAVDRLGKGLRVAPRDALIAAHAEPGGLATSFGAHRALDALGALSGPVLALALLRVAPGGYDALLVTSAGLAAIGVATIALWVPRATTAPAAATLEVVKEALGAPAARRIALATLALAGTRLGDGLLVLALQRRAGLPPSSLPWLYVASAATSLVLAWPAGQLADRVGGGRVVLAAQGALALGWTLLLALPSSVIIAPCLLLTAAHATATDGVLTALLAEALPPAVRTSGLACIGSGVDVARFGASLAFGAAWSAWGLGAALGAALGGVVLAAAAASSVLPARVAEAA